MILLSVLVTCIAIPLLVMFQMASHTRTLYVPHAFRELMTSAWIPNWADLIQRGTVYDIGAMLIRRAETVQEFFCFDHEGITTVVAELHKIL